MPEIGTSGSMSRDGKRRVAAWPKRPRPSSTLPTRAWRRFSRHQPDRNPAVQRLLPRQDGLSAAHCRRQGDDPADPERLHGWIIRKTYGNARLIYGNVQLIRALFARAPPWRSIMKKLIAILTIVTLIAVPTFVQSESAAPVSPSSSSFGGNGY